MPDDTNAPATGGAPGGPWLNDTTEFQQCFVCGARNPIGLHLHFRNEGDLIVAEFTGDSRHQGFPGVVHGGILASLLDEAMGRVSVLEKRWVMTARLELRYRAPARLGVPLRVAARATDSRPRLVRVRGWVSPVAEPDTVICEAEGAFLPLPAEMRDQAVADFPGLDDFF